MINFHEDDLVTCPECDQVVCPEDVCPEHEVCCWCDEDCKRRFAEEDSVEI